MSNGKPARKKSNLDSLLVGVVLLAVLGVIIATVLLSSPGLFNPSYRGCWLTPSNIDENNPASLNTSLTLHIANKRPVFGSGEIVRVTITDVIRGNAALLVIQNNGHGMADPGVGKEFLIVQVRFENLYPLGRGSSIADPYASMNVLQSDNRSAAKDINDTVSPGFPSAGTIAPGGSVEGHLTFIIDAGDPTPRFSYDPVGLGGQCPTFWFALY